MEIEEGQEPTPDIEVGNSPEVESAAQPNDGGINPVWDPIRQELGLGFEAIKPHLLEIDKGFNEGITKANSKYAPWKPFEEQGLTPDVIQQQLAVVQKLNESPEEIYQALGQFLEENGRLPTPAEAQDMVDDDDDEFISDEARQIQDLQTQLEEQRAFLQAQYEHQEQARIYEAAEADVEREFSAFEAAHPELSDQDKNEIYKRHLLYAQAGPESIKPLEEVAKEFFALTERVRSAPRANDFAPKLPGTGGGVPTAQRKDPSEYTREESQNVLAALVQQANQNS